MRIAAGLHPHNAKYWGPETEERLRVMLHDKRTSCLGEIGLDYHYDLSPREDQELSLIHIYERRHVERDNANRLERVVDDGSQVARRLLLLRQVPRGAFLHVEVHTARKLLHLSLIHI